LASPSLPVVVGDLQPGASTVFTLQTQIPPTVKELAITEHGIFKDDRRGTHAFSPGQVVLP